MNSTVLLSLSSVGIINFVVFEFPVQDILSHICSIIVEVKLVNI